jgi:hypothetical protein
VSITVQWISLDSDTSLLMIVKSKGKAYALVGRDGSPSPERIKR